MARITFNYDPADPDNVEVEFDITEEDNLDPAKLAEILATGVDSVVASCWDDNDDREQMALRVAKILLLAIDKRKGDDDE